VRALSARRQERLVGALKALADPTRLEIFRLISAQTAPVCVCDIVDHFDLSQPTISHHLRVLREAGLLRASRAGTWAFYAPDREGVELVAEVVALVNPAPTLHHKSG
jgi:ArsR family transcriptional regulator